MITSIPRVITQLHTAGMHYTTVCNTDNNCNNVVVLEKNRTRSTIFKSILEQLRKIFDRTT